MSVKKDKSQLNSLYAWMVWSCAGVFYLYEYALRASPSIMTNELMDAFGVTTTALGVLTSFYYYSYVALQAPCGVIVDWLGPRRVITFSSALCVIGSYLFAESHTLFAAQIGRFLLGVGSACAYLSCAKIGAEWFDSRKFALITSLTMMLGTFGGIFGTRPLAILVNAHGWRAAMVIMAVIGIGVTLGSWLLIRDRPKGHVSNNYAIAQEAGLLDGLKAIVKSPQIWLVGLYGALMYVPLSGFAELWAVPYLMQTYNVNNEVAAIASIMVFLGMGLGCPLSAWLSDYLQSHKRVMSLAALGAMLFFFIAIYVPGIPLNGMFAVLFIAGLFTGGQILYFAVAKESSPSYASGTSVGFTNGLLMSSGFIFQPLLGYLLDLAWDGQMTATGVRYYSAAVYQIAMTAIPISLSLAWVVLRFIRETYPKDQK
jgi:sugar phosphate permease